MNGGWHTAQTWDLNRVPTKDDDVKIRHSVIVQSNIEAKSIAFMNVPDAGFSTIHYVITHINSDLGMRAITANVDKWMLYAMHPDPRVIDLSGLEINSKFGGISCIHPSTIPGYQPTGAILCLLNDSSGTYPIMADPQPLSVSANLDETSNISASKQVSRWKSAGIRKGQVTIMWPKTGTYELDPSIITKTTVSAHLSFMARQPFRVLVFTPIWAMLGYISSIAPAQSGGQGWQAVTISITEG